MLQLWQVWPYLDRLPIQTSFVRHPDGSVEGSLARRESIGKWTAPVGLKEPTGAQDKETSSETPMKAASALSSTSFQPLEVTLNAALSSDDGFGPNLQGNIANGSLGVGRQTLGVSVLFDTGSNISFVSQRALERLGRSASIRKTTSVSVRLTDGTRTRTDQILRTKLTLGELRTFTRLRVLK